MDSELDSKGMEIQEMTSYRSWFGNYSHGWNLDWIIETRGDLFPDRWSRTRVYGVSWKKWSHANDSNIGKKKVKKTVDLVASMNCSLARETMYIYRERERTKANDWDHYCSCSLTIVPVLLLFLLRFPFSRLGSSGFVCKSKQEITTIDRYFVFQNSTHPLQRKEGSNEELKPSPSPFSLRLQKAKWSKVYGFSFRSLKSVKPEKHREKLSLWAIASFVSRFPWKRLRFSERV